MTFIFGQSWLAARAATSRLLLAGVALLFAGFLLCAAWVFLRAPFGARPGYQQGERGFIVSDFIALALGLAGFRSLLRQAGDPLLSDLGLTAFIIDA